MDNIETTPKRGRPTITDTNKSNRRNEVALSVLTAIIGTGTGIEDAAELSRFCYRVADTFIEIGDE